jgi:hypothetical protein
MLRKLTDEPLNMPNQVISIYKWKKTGLYSAGVRDGWMMDFKKCIGLII